MRRLDHDPVTGMAVAVLKTKRDRSLLAVDRFLQEKDRRSCSFVNLSSTALQELTETARRHHLVLTSCVEQNVGTVARLEWPTRATVDSPAASEICCPRCAIQQGKHPTNWRDGRTVQLHLCASCSLSSASAAPASPPSVMSPASVMLSRDASVMRQSCHAMSSAPPLATLRDGHPSEPPRTTLRVATGQAYDVYDVQLRAGGGGDTGGGDTPPVAPTATAPPAGLAGLLAPSPRRAGGMSSSPSAVGFGDRNPVSFGSAVSFAQRSETVGKARPGPAAFLPRLPSFATQTVRPPLSLPPPFPPSTVPSCTVASATVASATPPVTPVTVPTRS